MRRTVMAFLAAICTLVASPALSQNIEQANPPEFYSLDPRGVDLVSGYFSYFATEVVIGQPGNGGLVHQRAWVTNGWRDANQGSITVSGATYSVVTDVETEIFTLSGGVFTPASNSGATLTQSGPTYTFTSAAGAVASFTTTYCYTGTGVPCTAKAFQIERISPNGEATQYHYVSQAYIRGFDPVTGDPILGTAVRLQSVTNNRGYQLRYTYKANSIAGAGPLNTRVANWLAVASVTGVNNAVDYCGPTAFSCTYSRTWPSIAYVSTVGGPITSATDQSGRVTQYSFTSGALSGIRFPGSATDDITVATSVTTGRTTSVSGATGTWTYAYDLGSSSGTTTATGPNSQSLTVGYAYSIGRPNYVTNALGYSVVFQYDTQRRVKVVTSPEGDAATYTYDTRGNITQVVHSPKPGSGLSNIVVSATFPSSCTNTKTCNRPTSVTDGRGYVTDYTYDSSHGGILTITRPPPTPGTVRPQVRFSYAAQTAYYKNSAGVIAPATTSVTLPTSTSQCIVGVAPACLGTLDEARTTLTYGAAGIANNLVSTVVSDGSGDGSLTATTLLSYTPNGDILTVDGPLSGSADTTYFRHDAGRQLIGLIGPDPDGAGSLPRRAERFTYNTRGLVTVREDGTVTGFTDPDWSAFSPLQQVSITYDGLGRPSQQRVQSGSSTYNLTQVAYDASGRVDCLVARMNAAAFSSPPASACTLGTSGSYGSDRITKFSYDSADRATSAISGYGTSSTITKAVTYTANGKPQNLTDGQSNISIYVYDGYDRLSRTRFPNASGGGTSTDDYDEYGYDNASNVTSYRNRGNDVIAISYDALNRATLLNAPAGTNDISYSYDNLDRTLTAIGGGQTLSFAWDALSRKTADSGPLGTVSYQYDLANRPTRITWPDAYYAQYDYDLNNGLTAIRENGALSGAGILASYTYDSLGRRTNAAFGNGASASWTYDAVSRPTSLNHDLSGTANDLTIGLTYSPADQIATRTVSNPTVYAYVPTAITASYANSGKNQVTSAAGAAVAYDSRQNISAIGTASYGYNSYGQLTNTNPSGSSVTLNYDPVGRLYQTAGSSTTRFLYAGLQAIGEYNGTGTMIRRYVPGQGLDDVVSAYSGAGVTNRSWMLADERGSVVSISDEAGAATAINSYDEYGLPGANSGRFQYTGQMWVPEAQIYNYRARVYAPTLGRFLQPDPIGYLGGQNLYNYVSSDPINNVDPTGTVCVPCVGALIGAGVGGVLEAGQQYAEFGYVADWRKVGVQALVGGVAGGTGSWIAGAAVPTFGVVAATAIGSGLGNGIAEGSSAAVDTYWRGGTPQNIFEQSATNAVQGWAIGTVAGGVFAQGSKMMGVGNFSRPVDSFRPVVDWRPSRTAEWAATFGSQFREGTLTTPGEIAERFRTTSFHCTTTYVRGTLYRVCWGTP